MQPKNKPVKRCKYDAIFKADVLKMIDNGQSVAYVAQALGISAAMELKHSSTNGSNGRKGKKNTILRAQLRI